MEKLNINDLPREVRDLIKKENGIPTRKHNLTKDDVRGYAISVLNQVRNLSKSDITRVLNFALKVLEV